MSLAEPPDLDVALTPAPRDAGGGRAANWAVLIGE